VVVVMEEGAVAAQVDRVVAHLEQMGFAVHRSIGANRTLLGVVGDKVQGDPTLVQMLDGVQEIVQIS
jgi:3-deoxy-7-phosphoheptulonate synthase